MAVQLKIKEEVQTERTQCQIYNGSRVSRMGSNYLLSSGRMGFPGLRSKVLDKMVRVLVHRWLTALILCSKLPEQ